MNENDTLERINDILMSKLDEVDSIDVESDHAVSSAEAVNKLVDAKVKLQQAEQNKKESIFTKILVPIGSAVLGGLAVVGAAVVKGLFDQKIAGDQIAYYQREHEMAYDYEQTGEIKHLITSPTVRDVLREKPKMR